MSMHRRHAWRALACAALVSLACGAASAASVEELKVASKDGEARRLASPLAALALQPATRSAAPSAGARTRAAGTASSERFRKLMRVRDGTVAVEAFAKGDVAKLRTDLVALGLTNATTHGSSVSGRLPVSALAAAGASTALASLRPVLAGRRVGIAETQGDRAQRSDRARERFGVTGRGVKVGVLSDSFDCLRTPLTDDPDANFATASDDYVSGDLRKVQVLKELPEPDCSEIAIDEGRAMAQLIQDVAPESTIAFHTAFVSQEDFAAGIRRLADAGADVIVDDIIYYAEPMFQDGIIAQAVDDVRRRGVAYYSSAGNDARQSYESAFRLTSVLGFSGPRHDFRAGSGQDTLQKITVGADGLELLSFQWDEPFASASRGGRATRSDLDLIFYDADGNLVPLCNDDLEPALCQIPGASDNLASGDPVEIAILSNATGADVELQIGIELFAGPAPNRVKYVWFDLGAGLLSVDEYDTQSGTVYGHANAAGAEAVGAAAWYNTSAWGSPLWGAPCRPACAEIFSSAGGVRILFDAAGRRLPQPDVRIKPGVTGPDGGNTTFFFARITDPNVGGGEPDEFPNFFGTSASAPHVAAAAALVIDQLRKSEKERRKLPFASKRDLPEYLYWLFRITARDMRYRAGRITPPILVDSKGLYDFDTGFGFVDVARALEVVRALQ